MMSRRITSDFDSFVNFIVNYQLNINKEQSDSFKSMHKKLYAFLIFLAELKIQRYSEQSLLYLKEVGSDLMIALFCMIQGLYKTSKIQLRCSIENFLKALVLIKTNDVTEEKNVYRIFDIAKADKHFVGKVQQKSFTVIQKNYKTLCRTVHGDITTFDSISALALLPKYNEKSLRECVKLYNEVTEKFLEILFVNYYENVDKMHPENKKDFLDCLSKTTKMEVNNTLFSE